MSGRLKTVYFFMRKRGKDVSEKEKHPQQQQAHPQQQSIQRQQQQLHQTISQLETQIKQKFKDEIFEESQQSMKKNGRMETENERPLEISFISKSGGNNTGSFARAHVETSEREDGEIFSDEPTLVKTVVNEKNALVRVLVFVKFLKTDPVFVFVKTQI